MLDGGMKSWVQSALFCLIFLHDIAQWSTTCTTILMQRIAYSESCSF